MTVHPPLTNLFVYLVGFGGTGKLTIARASLHRSRRTEPGRGVSVIVP
jgi:hypothetical protein